MKKLPSSFLVLSFLLLISCQDALECIINKHPELSNQALSSAQVDQFYSDTITAQIKNEPSDDNYNYYFSIEGALPSGMEFFIDYRTIIIEGTPLVSGTYNFTVRLTVEQADNYNDDCENTLNDCDGLCGDTTSQAYTLLVN